MNKVEKAIVKAATNLVWCARQAGSYDAQGTGKSTLEDAVDELCSCKIYTGWVVKWNGDPLGSYYVGSLGGHSIWSNYSGAGEERMVFATKTAANDVASEWGPTGVKGFCTVVRLYRWVSP